MNSYISNIKFFAAQILSQKSIKSIKDTELYSKVLLLHDISPEKIKDIDEIFLLETVIQLLDTQDIQLIIPTFDFFHQIIMFNLCQKLLPVIPPSRSQIYANLLVDKIYKILKNKRYPENNHISIITVLVSLLNLSSEYLPLSCFLVIFNILADLHNNSKSKINRSAIRAALSSCVMNTFHDLKNGKIPTTPSLDQELVDFVEDQSVENQSKYELEVHSNSGENINENIIETTLSSKSTDKDMELKIFEDLQETTLKQTFFEYKLDWNDKKFIRAFGIFNDICKSAILKKTYNTMKLEDIQNFSFNVELILIALRHLDFHSDNVTCFVNIIKKYLFVAITQDLVCLNEILFRLTLQIFVKLVEKFHLYLKVEIQHFFSSILLNIIESSKTSFRTHHVFGTLTKLCSNAELMSLLFVNYDCDIESLNIFERLIDNICKIAESPSFLIGTNSSLTPIQKSEFELKIRGSCLSLLNNILLFIKDISDSHVRYTSTEKTDEDTVFDEEIEKTNKISISAFKERKDLLVQGIAIFNTKPKNGLDYLIDNKFINDNPDDIAKFLKQEDRLNPDKIGELLGREAPKFLEIMDKYVECFDFKDMDFLDSLRLFLSEFRLPGEAQKIDRLMEKFASHYCQQNRNNEIFTNADIAYYLAYSVIILTTDLHNPLVKNKITPQQYISMNTNTNNDGTANVPREYLMRVYDSIAAQEITLKSKSVYDKSIIDYKKPTNFTYSLSRITKMSLCQHTASTNQISNLEEIEKSDAVKTMFCTIWNQILVCFAWILNETDSSSLIYECLQGIRLSIRLACLYKLDLIRDTLISSLIPFSLLDKKVQQLHDIQIKNVTVIKTILIIAKEDGNYLLNSWKDILPCISHMELLQDLSTLKNRITNRNPEEIDDISRSLSIISKKSANFKTKFVHVIEQLTSQDLVVLIDQIFINSAKYDPESLIYLVSNLCKVAKIELFHSKPSRTFSLQKILEVMSYNMNRTRIIWKSIWTTLEPFLIEVSSLDNENISKFCMDSMRQLSCKLLEHKELENFQYQSEFLRPFEHILIHSKFRSVKELGVCSVYRLLGAYGNNIHSGWKAIFNILDYVVKELDPDSKEIVLDCLTLIVKDFPSSSFKWIDEILHLLKSLSKNIDIEDLSLRATKLVFVYYKNLSDCKISDEQLQNGSQLDLTSCDQKWNKGLKKIILDYVSIIQESSASVRAEALVLFLNIFKEFPDSIPFDKWIDVFEIFNILIKFIYDPNYHLSDTFVKDWINHISSAVICGVADIYVRCFDRLSLEVSRYYFECLKFIVSTDCEIYKNNIFFIIKYTLENLYLKLEYEHWKLFTDFVNYLFISYTPNELLETKIPQLNGIESCKPKHDGEVYQHHDYGLIDSDASFKLSCHRYHRNDCNEKLMREFGTCKFDIKLLKTIESLINTENMTNNSQKNVPHIFLKIHETCFKTILQIFDDHRTILMRFNKNEATLLHLCHFVENSFPNLKMVWNGKYAPNMGIQETRASICLVKLLHCLCKRNDSLDAALLEIFDKTIRSILHRLPELFSQCIDKDLGNILLEYTLKLVLNSPDQIFDKSIKSIYSNVYPLIKIAFNSRILDMLVGIFHRMDKYIQKLDLD